ncbi:hypothetical protein MXD62_20120 [Frankia sp. Mgl5]|uniref:hypothetical protein n=1 Tax=Frankia sp. Mgl5 TaxID=2933793 RepID=UPI00200CA1BA|nr:hypothetical protein [Frankia sp. Mgl5]MCK9929458.1 hypothetical protein [Frankia sp. Mgl5]
MSTDAAVELTRWAANTTPAKPRKRIYQLTDEDDYQAWLDQLAARMADDRAGAERAVRKPTTWKPRPEVEAA